MDTQLEVVQPKLVREAGEVLILQPDERALPEGLKRAADPSIGADLLEISKMGGKEPVPHPRVPSLE